MHVGGTVIGADGVRSIPLRVPSAKAAPIVTPGLPFFGISRRAQPHLGLLSSFFEGCSAVWCSRTCASTASARIVGSVRVVMVHPQIGQTSRSLRTISRACSTEDFICQEPYTGKREMREWLTPYERAMSRNRSPLALRWSASSI